MRLPAGATPKPSGPPGQAARRGARDAAGNMSVETHAREIVVWDVPGPLERGAGLTIKVGVRCEAACRPDAWQVEVHDDTGRVLASAVLGDEPWPGTAALYHAALELDAPATEGLHVWTVVAPADGAAPDSQGEPAGPARTGAESATVGHGHASAELMLRVVPAPECRLTVIAVDRERQTPVAGARVVLHPYRALTDARGVAEIGLPRGPYRLFVSGRGYLPFRNDGELTADATIRAELDLDRGPSDAELWA